MIGAQHIRTHSHHYPPNQRQQPRVVVALPASARDHRANRVPHCNCVSVRLCSLGSIRYHGLGHSANMMGETCPHAQKKAESKSQQTEMPKRPRNCASPFPEWRMRLRRKVQKRKREEVRDSGYHLRATNESPAAAILLRAEKTAPRHTDIPTLVSHRHFHATLRF